jgi:hypothetical protein
VEVEHDDGLKLLGIVKVDDCNDVNPPTFSLLYFDLIHILEYLLQRMLSD